MKTSKQWESLKLEDELKKLPQKKFLLVLVNIQGAFDQVKDKDTIEHKIRELVRWADEDGRPGFQAIRHAISQVQAGDSLHFAPNPSNRRATSARRKQSITFLIGGAISICLALIAVITGFKKQTVKTIESTVVKGPETEAVKPPVQIKDPSTTVKTIPDDQALHLLSEILSNTYWFDGLKIGSDPGPSPTFTAISDTINTPDYETKLYQLVDLATHSASTELRRAARLAIQLHITCRAYRSRGKTDDGSFVDDYTNVFKTYLIHREFNRDAVVSKYEPVVSLAGKSAIKQNQINIDNIIALDTKMKDELRIIASQQAGKKNPIGPQIKVQVEQANPRNPVFTGIVLINEQIDLSNCTILVRPSFKPPTQDEVKREAVVDMGIQVGAQILLRENAQALLREVEKFKPLFEQPKEVYPCLRIARESSYYIPTWEKDKKVTFEIDKLVNYRNQLVDYIDISVYSREYSLLFNTRSAFDKAISKARFELLHAISPGQIFEGEWINNQPKQLGKSKQLGKARLEFYEADQDGTIKAKISNLNPPYDSTNLSCEIEATKYSPIDFYLKLTDPLGTKESLKLGFRLTKGKLEGASNQYYSYKLEPVPVR